MNLETLETRENGNSNDILSKGKKQSLQLMKQCFTYNNYKMDDIIIIETIFKYFAVKYIFQEEVGDCGTPHLQGSIWFKKKTRWEELKLPFGNLMRWSAMRNEKACVDYCSKDETRNGNIYKWGFPRELKLINPNKVWQVKILNIIKEEPNDRLVYWFWSKEGGVGKSQFCKYLCAKEHCVFIDEGKKADIMFSIMEADMDLCNTVIFDIPRDNGNKVSYKSIESIKNGMVYSPKYESKHKLFNSPHLICFANCEPEYDKLSMDRWMVEEIF